MRRKGKYADSRPARPDVGYIRHQVDSVASACSSNVCRHCSRGNRLLERGTRSSGPRLCLHTRYLIIFWHLAPKKKATKRYCKRTASGERQLDSPESGVQLQTGCRNCKQMDELFTSHLFTIPASSAGVSPGRVTPWTSGAVGTGTLPDTQPFTLAEFPAGITCTPLGLWEEVGEPSKRTSREPGEKPAGPGRTSKRHHIDLIMMLLNQDNIDQQWLNDTC